MDPNPAKQKSKRGRRHDPALAARVSDFPLDTTWWLRDPLIRALDRDERAGYQDVRCFLWGSRHVGVATEEQIRVWAGYTPEEWQAHREPFRPLFRMRPDGLWVDDGLRALFLAQMVRLRRHRRGAKVASGKRWGHNEMHPARIPARNASRNASRNPSVLNSQRLKQAVPHRESPTGPSPLPDLLPAAAPLALVQGVMARVGREGSSS
jgi:hypothetical protein